MKKVLSLVIILLLIFSITSCNGNTKGLEIKEVTDISVPAFEVTIFGVKVTNEDLKDLSLYQIETSTVNSSGTEKDYKYVGYKMSDILKLKEINADTKNVNITCTDGFKFNYEGDILEDGVLLGVLKNDETFKNGPWFAPCVSNASGDYGQDLLKIEVGDNETKEDEKVEEIAFPQDPVVEDKTGKINFNPYSFKINGKEITNSDLEGLNIYRITVTTKNSKDVISQSKYSGYVLKDVLEKLGLSGNVKTISLDGYESEIDHSLVESTLTLLAIEKDKAPGENDTIWIAPCSENKTSSYIKEVKELNIE